MDVVVVRYHYYYHVVDDNDIAHIDLISLIIELIYLQLVLARAIDDYKACLTQSHTPLSNNHFSFYFLIFLFFTSRRRSVREQEIKKGARALNNLCGSITRNNMNIKRKQALQVESNQKTKDINQLTSFFDNIFSSFLSQYSVS